MDYKTAKGWLREEEREYLYLTAWSARVNVIVNIGVEYGASLACFAQRNQFAAIFGIDLDISKCEVAARNITLIQGDSGEVVQKYPDEGGWPIDLLFIDGDHSYEGVKRDLAWLDYLNKTGLVIFHDCYDFDDPTVIHQICPGVNKAVSEWYLYSRGSFIEYPSVGTMRIFQKVAR